MARIKRTDAHIFEPADFGLVSKDISSKLGAEFAPAGGLAGNRVEFRHNNDFDIDHYYCGNTPGLCSFA